MMSGKRKRLITLGICLLLLVLALDPRLIVRTYEVESTKINTSFRIALVTDLHSCKYGEDQKYLIQAIENQKPDIVLLGGDIFDDVIEDTNTDLFLAGIALNFPCYYVTGNHEYWSGSKDFAKKMMILEKHNVRRLSAKCDDLTLYGDSIQIAGVDDPDSYLLDTTELSFTEQLDQVDKLTADHNFSILLSHRPEYFETYSNYDFDLVLSGHAHGGQWRIPLILNGLLAPDQGLLPQYAGGDYVKNETTMIVSRGLARETTRIPRIFNRPELVIIDVK